MSKQDKYFTESKLKFYLRNSHSTHPCQIYLVASVDGKRYRIYTKMKVYANQWDQERQLAVLSNVQSKQDNRNNKIANTYSLTNVLFFCNMFEEGSSFGAIL